MGILLALCIGATILIGFTNGLGCALGTALALIVALFVLADVRNQRQGVELNRSVALPCMQYFDCLEPSGLNTTALLAAMLYTLVCVWVSWKGQWSAQFCVSTAYAAGMTLPGMWWLTRYSASIAIERGAYALMRCAQFIGVTSE